MTCPASSTIRTRRSARATSPCSRRPRTFKLPDGECSIPVATGDFPLTLVASGGKARFSGFITGNGPLRIEAAQEPAVGNLRRVQQLLPGDTTLVRGVLKLSKPASAIAISGRSGPWWLGAGEQGDGVIWGADGQIAPSAVVTLRAVSLRFWTWTATRPRSQARAVEGSHDPHRQGGVLQVKQLLVDGKRLTDGAYQRRNRGWKAREP